MNAISESTPGYWNNYRIERVNSSHYPAIIMLLKTASRTIFNHDYLQKKYETIFLGAKNIGYIAFDGDLAISLQMGLVIPLCYQNKTYLSLQACDAATHPAYRRKNLWALLNSYMLHQASLENLAGIIGYPNQHSYHLFVNKLNYKIAGIFKSYTIVIYKIPFWKIANKLNLGKLIIQNAGKNLKNYQVPPISFSSFDRKDYLILNRRPDYLEYKEKKGSFFILLHETYFWVKFRQGALFIGDLKTPSEAHFDRAIEQLKSICYKSGIESITFQSQEGSFEESLFAKKYQPLITTPMVYTSFSSDVPYHLLKCTYADLDTF